LVIITIIIMIAGGPTNLRYTMISS